MMMLNDLGTLLGRSWDVFGMCWGCVWDCVGMMVGLCWDDFGMVLASLWHHVGISSSQFLIILIPSKHILDTT